MTQKSHPKIYVAGHRGMVGSAIVRKLLEQGNQNIIVRTHAELDLTNQLDVANFFKEERPDQVYLAAAKVGGIYANQTYPAEFIYQNLMAQSIVIHEAFLAGVKRLLFLGSSCIYPKNAQQPITESELLSGSLEPTNEPYAIAKIAGIKMCDSYNHQYGKSDGVDFRSIMPTNLYGPGDNYHPLNSHVIPALIKRIHEAKLAKQGQILIWGSGAARREFLYVDDLAAASVFLMGLDREAATVGSGSHFGHINVGYGSDITILELSKLLAEIIGFDGDIKYDLTKPDGTMQKLLDSSKIQKLGWSPKVDLIRGLTQTYQSFLNDGSLVRIS
jgi:GDP-L-fucose synthase